MRVGIPILAAAFLAAQYADIARLFTAPVAQFSAAPIRSTFNLGLLGYTGYCAFYLFTALMYSGLEVDVESEVVDPGDTVRLHVDLPGDADRTANQLEAFVSQRRVYRSVNRQPFSYYGWINPRMLFERTRSLEDVSTQDGRVTVEFDLPDNADPSSHGSQEFTGLAATERWDVGVRVQSATYANYHVWTPFVVRHPEGR